MRPNIRFHHLCEVAMTNMPPVSAGSAQTLDREEESPDVVRMSLAAAMTLDFAPGSFYRNACLYCINLLLTYKSSCAGRCAYCGLSPKRESGKSFIRVSWPALRLEDVAQAIVNKKERVKRICISMLTNRRALADTVSISRTLREAVDIPISVLVAPTIVTREHLQAFKDAGVDKIGVAIDMATPELFDRYRGRGVHGPHVWQRYWDCLAESLEIFGRGMAGSHFMVGMGETEQEMASAMQRVRDMGGFTHLFSFFPEAGSLLADRPAPPLDQYRRIQLARWIIDNDLGRAGQFDFAETGQISGYGLPDSLINELLDNGSAFRTSGCTGRDGEVACNRPYANWRPGPGTRNYPFAPDENDRRHIRLQLGLPQYARK